MRNSKDVMKDRNVRNLWIVGAGGDGHRPLTMGNSSHSSPRWSPDGGRLAYIASGDGGSQIYVRWMDTGQIAKLSNLTSGPANLTWSPDGQWLAFSMRVPVSSKPFATMPTRPEGAEWAPAAKVITKLRYRADGAGYLKDGYSQLFVLPAEGGTPRQITSGEFNHRGRLAWTPDNGAIVFSANRQPEGEYEPLNSELHAVVVASGEITALTTRNGPDAGPVFSPDGSQIAYTGFDDQLLGYQITRAYVMDREGGEARCLSLSFDRDIGGLTWRADGRGLFFQFDDEGDTSIGFISLVGESVTLATHLGGTSLGRPYAGGSYSATAEGVMAYTYARVDRPADVAVVQPGGQPLLVTSLNEDLLAHKSLAEVEEIWCESSHDGRRIQAWIARPPGFDASKSYPMILEIHGGPFANYGARFSTEVQLYAAAGYVVLYVNPRGSTSYGHEFGNAIHHAYPGYDYDDLMSAVDNVLARGFVDKDRLFVTGGSGGGVLTAWIVGKTDRFRAAVVAKPVIHWTSFALTADAYNFFYKYWFPGFPWDHQEQYWKRSPLSLVGNVTTPTMLLTGEVDYRTPISESEQYYQALKLLRVDTAMVRIPEASHGIAARSSHLIAKVVHILEWFERHTDEQDDGGN
ncbi:MAG: dipeptidyl aminopeptidase/acylaminoacyl peptidase [Planctomycetota bacterium]